MSEYSNDGRSRVYDAPGSTVRRRKPVEKHHAQSNMKTEDARRLPVEMTPVLEAVKEYARRTHSLGALQGAHALKKLANEIRKAMPGDATMRKIAEQAEKDAEELSSFISRVYENV